MTLRSSGAGGFTLIETLVVVVILALMLGIFAGFLPHRSDRLAVASAAQGVASALRLARADAIAAARPAVFAPLKDGTGYTVAGRATPLPPRITLTMAGPPVIRFAPDGSSSGGVVRVGGEVNVVEVKVDWLTGRVWMLDAPR
jgi:general secretion pathway protein H